MTVFIGFESALKYLLANGLQRERAVYGRRFQELRPTRAKPQLGKRPDARRIKALGFPGLSEDEKLEICVGAISDRPHASYIHARAWSGPNRGTYLAVDNEYCVATPEAVFVQLANDLSTAHLIELGCMLCGTNVPLSIPSSHHNNTLPLTTTAKIRQYVKKCTGVYGVAHARSTLPWIVDNSASVMETRLLMLLCLPHRLGGYGLPIPALNKPVTLPKKLATRTVSSRRKPDLYWVSEKVALEYDSKGYHQGDLRIAQDRQRANELESAGIKLFSAGPKELYDPLALDRLATQIAKAIGCKLRFRQGSYLERRFNLHNELLGSREWELLKHPADL